MKKLLLGSIIGILSATQVLNTTFKVDSSTFSFSKDSKTKDVVDVFDKGYNLSSSIESIDKELEKEMQKLAKETTYLLLGPPNNTNESSEDYYRRHKDYDTLRYEPKSIPKDESSVTGLDEDSQEFKDDVTAGINLPGMFNTLEDMNVIYSTIGNIRVTEHEELVSCAVSFPNVTLSEESEDNPMEFVTVNTNLMLYYYYKKLDDKYKLYFIMGETSDKLEDYLTQVEETENTSSYNAAPAYDNKLQELYDFSKLEAVSDADVDKIREANADNIVRFDSYYNNYVVASANGFFINNGLVVTTWNFLEKSLMEAQFITVSDAKGNLYKIEGIVTANPETDVVVIKLDKEIKNKTTLGNVKELKVEDAVFAFASKTGVGLTSQGGIVVSYDGYIESALPLGDSDEGSPLINELGEVVGMNTAKQVNTSISLAIKADILKEIQDKFDKIKYDDVKAISFDDMKSKYYYVKYDDEEVKNSIPSDIWKSYSKIGNIEKNISLKLVKASYRDDIVSLRYYNAIPNFIGNIQMAASFREELIKAGYKEKISSLKKYIYENNEYQVIIMSEFNYLIVVMVKL